MADPAFAAAAERNLTSPAERVRAERILDPIRALRLLSRRATLRLVLARYVDVAPANLRIVTAPGGKPVLIPGPAFSVAHSGDLFVVAVGSSGSIGVDVERLRPIPRAQSIAERWFGVSEVESLMAVSEGSRDLEFMRLWTAKESLAKRHGAGLRLMKGTAGGPPVAELDVYSEIESGRLAYFHAGEGYLGALAGLERIEEVNLLRPGRGLWGA
jgi:4'-phosphopantetheinyl transferase